MSGMISNIVAEVENALNDEEEMKEMSFDALFERLNGGGEGNNSDESESDAIEDVASVNVDDDAKMNVASVNVSDAKMNVASVNVSDAKMNVASVNVSDAKMNVASVNVNDDAIEDVDENAVAHTNDVVHTIVTDSVPNTTATTADVPTTTPSPSSFISTSAPFLDTPQGSISTDSSPSPPQPDPSEVREQFVANVNAEVSSLLNTNSVPHPDYDTYHNGTTLHDIYSKYIVGNIFIPSVCTSFLDIADYIQNVTTFTYNPFDAPNITLQHSIPVKVIRIEQLNRIFNHKFADPSAGEYHFNDLDLRIADFVSAYGDLPTIVIEYSIVRSFMGKLIVALNTNHELSLRDNTMSRIGSDFKQAIVSDIECMARLQSQAGKMNRSWKVFISALLSIGADNLIYVHESYKDLNEKLKLAYSEDFLTEHLLANMLKCYLPSVALNYFYAIKSVYLIARLLSLYLQLRLYEGKPFETIVDDVNAIAAAGVMMYENMTFLFKQTPRTLPKYDKEMSEQMKMYILNHLVTGPQYFILKMLERGLPVVASMLL